MGIFKAALAWSRRKIRPIKSLLFCVAMFNVGQVPSNNQALASPHGVVFDHTKEPSKEDWRYFLRLEETAQEKIWTSFEKKGVKLSDWSWAWRLGWIRACHQNRKPFCNQILLQALLDRAAVVRAEGATALGRIYEKTGRKDIIKSIEKAGLDQRNFRNGKPLFIQKRIIFAIVGIGGSTAQGAAQNIAKSHKELDNYLKKLQH